MNIENTYRTYSKAPMNQLKKENGFTLLEVLIALTIFAVGLLAVAALQASAIKMNSTSNKLTNVSTLAMDQIEKLSALSYTDTDLNEGTYNPASPSADYSISYKVTDDSPMDNIKNIVVTVTGRGKTEKITFLKPNVGSI